MKRLAVLLVLVSGILPAGASTETLAFRCDGRGGIAAMENSYIAATGVGDCWFHIGHHTYDAGAPYRLHRITGSAFTVETLFSPPTELGTGRSHSVLTFDGSLDGVTWSPIAVVPYNMLASRLHVPFDVPANDAVARFIRIRQPRSAAQGLSGYLDSSNFDVVASPAAVGAMPTPSDELTCERDVMERFFAEHPCWFGGINRYDSPSVFHTYPVAPGHVASVHGEATIMPWRTDDFYYDGADPLTAELLVQSSTDGETWTEAGRASIPYGIPTSFVVDVERSATFVRLVGEYHHGVTRHPALKHVRATMVTSRIRLDRD